MAHILVVDDDPQVLRSIQRALERVNHQVSVATNGQEGLNLLYQQRPDLVILDVIMPEMGGIEVCRRIRADPFVAKLPVIFLTAKSGSENVIQGFDAGADEYLTKPFELVELPARINALLRRTEGGSLDVGLDYLIVGKLRLHTTNPEVYIGTRKIELRPMEHRLLRYLMLNAGQPVAIDQLLEDVWEVYPGTGDPQLVYQTIKNLRDQIEDSPESPQYLRNIRGRGYVIEG